MGRHKPPSVRPTGTARPPFHSERGPLCCASVVRMDGLTIEQVPRPPGESYWRPFPDGAGKHYTPGWWSDFYEDHTSDKWSAHVVRSRPVVAQLSAAGMSTRAIAPVVGVSPRQAAYDRSAGVQSLHTCPTPEPAEVTPDVSPAPTPEPAEVAEVEEAPATEVAAAPTTVTGLDGKTYTRPAPPEAPKPKRAPLGDSARDIGLTDAERDDMAPAFPSREGRGLSSFQGREHYPYPADVTTAHPTGLEGSALSAEPATRTGWRVSAVPTPRGCHY